MNARLMGLYFGYICVALGILLPMCCAVKLLMCNECSTALVLTGDALLLWGLYRVGLMR
ncbi:MAG: hypothetical protein IJC75_01905 [Oscillospiraceae bacterium]|nr:hypothetical protein [Oscillospiraceae bacterium]